MHPPPIAHEHWPSQPSPRTSPDVRPRGRDRACGVVDDDGGYPHSAQHPQDARDHVLYSLPLSVDADEAEEHTDGLVEDYLNRVKGGRLQHRARPGGGDLVLHAGLRARLVDALDPVSDAVLRLHYGDGMPLEQVERTAAIDGSALMAAQEA